MLYVMYHSAQTLKCINSIVILQILFIFNLQSHYNSGYTL